MPLQVSSTIKYIYIYIKTKLKKFFSSKSGRKIGSFFNFKDKIPINVRSLLAYQCTCSSCNATYFGKTKKHFKVQMCEHLGISYKTGKSRKLSQG